MAEWSVDLPLGDLVVIRRWVQDSLKEDIAEDEDTLCILLGGAALEEVDGCEEPADVELTRPACDSVHALGVGPDPPCIVVDNNHKDEF